MEIQKRPKRVRIHAMVSPETKAWLDAQHDKHTASYGVLIDSLVAAARKKDDDDAR